jgi:predicted alpha/beta-hydrolase family hydrolase
VEQGKRRPNPQPILLATIRSAVEAAAREAPGLPLFAGGKSMGGRMTSLAAAGAPLQRVAGLVFLGFPLHAVGHPSTERAGHLPDVGKPMLFLQGTRDRLADLDLLRPICQALSGSTLHVVEDADHSFKVLKRTGRTWNEVLGELADVIERWTAEVLA